MYATGAAEAHAFLVLHGTGVGTSSIEQPYLFRTVRIRHEGMAVVWAMWSLLFWGRRGMSVLGSEVSRGGDLENEREHWSVQISTRACTWTGGH